jgi:cell division protease FtsH
MAESETGMMDNFSNIIGYEDEKKVLRQLADMCRNPKKYDALGVTIPHGVVLYGKPGLGKTVMAEDFLKETGRTFFVLRKDVSKEEFMARITKVFQDAAKSQPSVILLDDMDKFGSGKNSEEYVMIQSLMDAVQDKNVFLIATANSIYDFPVSLLRNGRIDSEIEILPPTPPVAEKIIQYYLSSKKISRDINYKTLSMILEGESCAYLEGILNQAGISAAYEGREEISMDDIVKAILQEKIDSNCKLSDTSPSSGNVREVAYHEAGHLAAGLLGGNEYMVLSFLEKGTKGDYSNSGSTDTVSKEPTSVSQENMEKKIREILGGMVAIDIRFGKIDVGASEDIKSAKCCILNMVGLYGCTGLSRTFCLTSGNNSIRDTVLETAIQGKWDEEYAKTKLLLKENWSLVESLTEALLQKRYLVYNEIQDIYARYLARKNCCSSMNPDYSSIADKKRENRIRG